MRGRLRRVRRLQSLHSVVELGAEDDHTGPVVGRHRMPAARRVLHVEIWTSQGGFCARSYSPPVRRATEVSDPEAATDRRTLPSGLQDGFIHFDVFIFHTLPRLFIFAAP